ncbi:MAG: GGGtGRT protein [Dysosmobacter sp.]|nr:GGGtGRT protein [Dysosmobacter sp.]
MSDKNVKSKHLSMGNNPMVGATVAVAVAVAESQK